MNVSLNEQIRQRDLQNLVTMKYSKPRSWRVFRIFLLLMLPLGVTFYTIWDAVSSGLKPTGATVDMLLIDGLMFLGSLLQVLAMNFLLGLLFFGAPVLATASWLAYRTFKKGSFSLIETVSASIGFTVLFGSLVTIIRHASLIRLYEIILDQWLSLIPFLIIVPLSAFCCQWIIRKLDAEEGLAAIIEAEKSRRS